LARSQGTPPISRWSSFGTISALYGLNNGYITEKQYSVLVTVVIGSAVVPAVLAQRFFEPGQVPEGTLDRSALTEETLSIEFVE
jgi:hypothetical protein